MQGGTADSVFFRILFVLDRCFSSVMDVFYFAFYPRMLQGKGPGAPMRQLSGAQGGNAMNILPSLTDAKKIAAAGQYKVLPVSCEILSDICTPIEAVRILKNVSTHCYLL